MAFWIGPFLVSAVVVLGDASRWTIESLTGQLPGSRWGHTLTLLPGSTPAQALVCGTNPAGQEGRWLLSVEYIYLDVLPCVFEWRVFS